MQPDIMIYGIKAAGGFYTFAFARVTFALRAKTHMRMRTNAHICVYRFFQKS
ncbi:hypothetical protein SDC9_89454 [bioreactor metagenome]|uniref:Uncharacterized protein n=1 Tax=bioreactor metagenome TaxID=1076179 RepID=A0A644ZVX2_9ZZZZ